MASVKDLRSKPLSSMSYDELTAYIKKASNAGYSISTSKDLGKAEDLRKVLKPEKYGSETVESAKNKLLVNTTPETQAKLGIAKTTTTPSGTTTTGVGFTGTGAPASLDVNKMYEESITSPEITALEKEINDKKTAVTTAMTNINDNPYYSEATRTGHLNKLQEASNSELRVLQDMLTQKKADVQTKLNIAMKQYDINRQEYQDNISRLNLLISTGALANASGSDIASIALATGMSTAMINGIINKMKTDSVKSTLYTDDNTGMVTAIDTATGKVLYKTQVSTPKESGGSSGTSKITDKDVGVALTALDEFDNLEGGTKDYMLSAGEIQAVYQKLMKTYGNSDTVLTLIEKAMDRGKYSEWEG